MRRNFDPLWFKLPLPTISYVSDHLGGRLRRFDCTENRLWQHRYVLLPSGQLRWHQLTFLNLTPTDAWVPGTMLNPLYRLTKVFWSCTITFNPLENSLNVLSFVWTSRKMLSPNSGPSYIALRGTPPFLPELKVKQIPSGVSLGTKSPSEHLVAFSNMQNIKYEVMLAMSWPYFVRNSSLLNRRCAELFRTLNMFCCIVALQPLTRAVPYGV